MADGGSEPKQAAEAVIKHQTIPLKGNTSLDQPDTLVKNGSMEPELIKIGNGNQSTIASFPRGNGKSDPDKYAEVSSTPSSLSDAPTSSRSPSTHARPTRETDKIDRADASPGTKNPLNPSHGRTDAVAEKVGEEGVCRMHKFWLYETASRFYVVGGDVLERKFRLLKLDRATESGDLSIAEDDIVYTKQDMNQLLDTLGDGNKNSGGMKLKYSFWGLLGFVKFTGAYYMLLVTKRSHVAILGGHYIYQIDATELVSLTVSAFRSKVEKDPEEARFVGILDNLDLTRSFYFSYSYDITRTMQHNILRQRQELLAGNIRSPFRDQNSMFVWNHHFLRPASAVLKTAYDWCLPIIHGFVDQAQVDNLRRKVYIILIARRSRFYAGARFLKRGTNDLGYVANDVETEQIVSHMLSSSFHAPGPEFFANPNYTSYVQHRGSIPLYWTQDSSGVSPKPDIELNLIDPFYSAAALHFDDLFERYGLPIYVLNLIKSRERTPRESVLLREYANAIAYLNQFLPDKQKIRYRAWDMSRAAKSPDQDVIGTLESVAEEVVALTGFFRNGSHASGDLRIQRGIARTNCIDCLDRTNAAQFVIGKRALNHQLHALGITDDELIDFDTEAINLLTGMFHSHGNTIAVQYGGSHLVNTVETYRNTNHWHTSSRDMVESFKRYYNNSFLDKQRQEAYNLFLGNYIFAQGQPMLWDLSTDYYLHHADPRAWFARKRRDYRDWFSPGNLSEIQTPITTQPQGILANKPLAFFDEWFFEYYRPHQLSTFAKMLPCKMRSTKNADIAIEEEEKSSPFWILEGHEGTSPVKRILKKGVAIADPAVKFRADDTIQRLENEQRSHERNDSRHWLLQFNEAETGKVNKEKKIVKDKSAITQWTLDQFVSNSLNPSVPSTEAHEYQRYVNHPLNLPLVVSTDIPPNANLELVNYIDSMSTRAVSNVQTAGEDLADYVEFLDIGEEPLTVTEADASKKRYKAYRQWVKGKSLFKQRVEP